MGETNVTAHTHEAHMMIAHILAALRMITLKSDNGLRHKHQHLWPSQNPLLQPQLHPEP
jgi:hypothetical protein